MVASAIEHTVWDGSTEARSTRRPTIRGSHQADAPTADRRPSGALADGAGRLSNEKNLDDLLEPVHRMLHVRFAFVGSGPASDWLKECWAPRRYSPAT